MLHLDTTLDIDKKPWRDLDGAAHGALARICRIPHGLVSGRAAVAVAILTSDGEYVIGQTSLDLLDTAVRALVAAEKQGA